MNNLMKSPSAPAREKIASYPGGANNTAIYWIILHCARPISQAAER